MRLNNLEIAQLLPGFMREDGANKGLSLAIDTLFRDLDAKSNGIRRWDQIASMGHAELDELAYECNIVWYDSAAGLAVKRKVGQDSDAIFRKLGTKWAVETLLSTFYGDVKVLRWWEYGGLPHHFKILTTNPDILKDPERFYFLLNTVKRASAWLDSVDVGITGDNIVFIAQTINEHSHETIMML